MGGDGKSRKTGDWQPSYASLRKCSATGNLELCVIGSWARQVKASGGRQEIPKYMGEANLGKRAAMGNLEIQALGSWAGQV